MRSAVTQDPVIMMKKKNEFKEMLFTYAETIITEHRNRIRMKKFDQLVFKMRGS